jgi:hypothetical protein
MELKDTIPQTGKFWFTPEVEKQIRRNDRLMLKIAEANKNVRVASVERWFVDKNECLTTMANLELIRAELGFLEVQELIEKVEIKETA